MGALAGKPLYVAADSLTGLPIFPTFLEAGQCEA
jgi:hypothetical protein